MYLFHIIKKKKKKGSNGGFVNTISATFSFWKTLKLLNISIMGAKGLSVALCMLTHFSHIAAYMRQKIWSALVQVMAWRRFGAKPLNEPVLAYCQLDLWNKIWNSNRYTKLFIHVNAFETVVCWPFCCGLNDLKRVHLTLFWLLIFGPDRLYSLDSTGA